MRVVESDDPLVRGIDDFEVEDEPYYCERFGNHEVLLEGSYNTPSAGYLQSDFGS